MYSGSFKEIKEIPEGVKVLLNSFDDYSTNMNALFDELIKKNKEKKMQEDESALVVAAECEDMQTAEDLCNKLESNGIKAMIVEKDSPVYIKGDGSPVQIQVCRKDLEKSKEIE